MKSSRKVVVLFLATAFLAGCRHRAKVLPPPAAQAPTLPVYLSEANLPPPQVPPPEQPQVIPGPPTPALKPKKHHPVHRRVRHTEVPAEKSPTTDQGAELAINGAGNDQTPIGQLTAAGESTNTPRRNEILDEINATQKGLDGLKNLNKEQQTTATQIKTFLTKARQALNQEDLDGAHILVTKAKVLLQELTGK